MKNRIINFFRNILRCRKKDIILKNENQLPSKKLYKKYYLFMSVDEVPDEIEENVLYYIGEVEFKWLLSFKCPCGCKDIIQLNLLKEGNPRWRVKIHDDGDVSVYPSVNRQINCHSHFNITKNSVRWWEWFEDWN